MPRQAKRKTFKKRMDVFKGKERVKKEKLLKDIAEVYKRYTDLSETKHRWKNNCTKDFKEAIKARKPNDFNPVVNMMLNKVWVEDKLYASIYMIPRFYSDQWVALSYRIRADYIYVPYNISRINIEECNIIYSYPASIKEMIVKWDFTKLEKAIDLFCKTLNTIE